MVPLSCTPPRMARASDPPPNLQLVVHCHKSPFRLLKIKTLQNRSYSLASRQELALRRKLLARLLRWTCGARLGGERLGGPLGAVTRVVERLLLGAIAQVAYAAYPQARLSPARASCPSWLPSLKLLRAPAFPPQRAISCAAARATAVAEKAGPAPSQLSQSLSSRATSARHK